MRPWRLALYRACLAATFAATFAAASACQSPLDSYRCAGDLDCGAGGRCEPNEVCSFADSSCESGFRFGDVAGSLSESCVVLEPDPAQTIALGTEHSCALLESGHVQCWGGDAFGQRGDGVGGDPISASPRLVLTAGEPLVIDDVAGARIVAGAHHSCVVDGAIVWCWGRNDAGQIDLGQPAQLDSAVGFTASGVAQLALGAEHSCSATTDTVRCWGRDDLGQLGDGSPSATPEAPGEVAMPAGTIAIGAGARFSCASTAAALHCWGDNRDAQLGIGAAGSENPMPQEVALAGIVDLALGQRHACARDGAGEVSCWGSGDGGVLGTGDLADRLTPATIGGITALDVAVGRDHSCALLGGGQVACWGSDDRGQAGETVGGEPVLAPRTLAEVEGAIGLAAGAAHSCAVVDDGSVACWGDGSSAQIGRAVEAAATPVTVTFSR